MNLLTAKRTARVLPDQGDSQLYAAGMNPLIFEEFVGEVLDRDLEPVIWEPFAGVAAARFQDFAESVMVQLVSHDLNPRDDRVRNADSTLDGPDVLIGGMLFHPPYFGAAPSGAAGDVAHLRDMNEYRAALTAVIRLGAAAMVPHGLACVVGRHYHFGGKQVHLDVIMGELVAKEGFRLVDVWLSEPDVVQIMEKL